VYGPTVTTSVVITSRTFTLLPPFRLPSDL
jgi:hypothetical protein